MDSISTEVYRPAFTEPPSSKVSYTAAVGALVSPDISYGLPYPGACTKHVKNTFKRSRVYIICSATLSRVTKNLERLIEALEKENISVVGVQKGMRPHTPWSQIMEVVNEMREGNADCLVTLGAGSLTDGAKITVLVHIYPTRHRSDKSLTTFRRWQMGSQKRLNWPIILSRPRIPSRV